MEPEPEEDVVIDDPKDPGASTSFKAGYLQNFGKNFFAFQVTVEAGPEGGGAQNQTGGRFGWLFAVNCCAKDPKVRRKLFLPF